MELKGYLEGYLLIFQQEGERTVETRRVAEKMKRAYADRHYEMATASATASGGASADIVGNCANP